jgi:L-histidine N-alpha-methyltransferase
MKIAVSQTTEGTSPEQLPGLFRRAIGNGNVVLQATVKAINPVQDFALSVERGLGQNPRRLECRFLYDARGSELYEAITRQPEYYPTRTEASILARHAGEIAGITGPAALVELGSGSSTKTDHLLAAYLKQMSALCYVPIDVSDSALNHVCRTLPRRRPGVQVIGIHGTYQEGFPLFRTASPALVIFLGSTIGNLDPTDSVLFLSQIADHLSPGDYFLLGLDLVKSPSVLEAAYNDAAGVTEAFTRNLFARMNRELGSEIDLSVIEHLARYNPQQEQIEIHARFRRAQTIRVAPLNLSFAIAAGEKIRTEISRKFRLGEIRTLLEEIGLRTRRIFTDEREWFGLLLLQKPPR